jgi:hypothetical protein
MTTSRIPSSFLTGLGFSLPAGFKAVIIEKIGFFVNTFLPPAGLA